jgi:hypothetical protein
LIASPLLSFFSNISVVRIAAVLFAKPGRKSRYDRSTTLAGTGMEKQPKGQHGAAKPIQAVKSASRPQPSEPTPIKPPPQEETRKEADFGFSTVGAAYPAFSCVRGDLTMDFIDSLDNTVKVRFTDFIGLKWQPIHSTSLEVGSCKSYEILNSNWMNIHLFQDVIRSNEGYRHLMLCFNFGGVYEVLCREVDVERCV